MAASDEYAQMRSEIIDGLVAKGADRESLESLPETPFQTLLLQIALHLAGPQRYPQHGHSAARVNAWRFT